MAKRVKAKASVARKAKASVAKKAKPSVAKKAKLTAARKPDTSQKAKPQTGARAQRAVSTHAATDAEHQYIPWHTIALEELNPLLQRQFVVGQEIMMARVLMKKGCVVPEHSHHNEQLTYILDGALKFWIAGKEIVVHSGEVLCIPANMLHKAEALEDTVDLDVFNPPRADWINKTDQYLRGSK